LDYSDEERASLFADPNRRQELIDHLQHVFQATPLEIIAIVLYRYDHLDETAEKVIGSYNEFIGILADEGMRIHLEQLAEQDADADPVYQGARKLSHIFRDGLLAFFFDPKSEMEALTKNYGVF
jgi:hypothetical protein